jgi:hypothetical protein
MRTGSLLVVTALCGCSSPDPLLDGCPATVAEPLVNATTVESYLGLSEREIRAVVKVTNDGGEDAPVCSGAFVTEDWVVTAAHCLVIDSARVVVPGSKGEPPGVVRVVERVPHPSLDVALLRVESSDAGFEPIPLGLAAAEDRRVTVGDVVAIAGYGRTETEGPGELRFLAEPVVAVEEDSVLVSGHGESGACEGDSGGPLLVRDGKGRPIVAGVLTSGAASCVERDRYVRLDGLSSWLEQTTGGFTTTEVPCGEIDDTGRCLYGSALFCNGGRLEAEACSGDRTCGWDVARSGYRCVAPAEDPCDGVDAVGACRDGAALTCGGGILRREPCACGRSCRIDGKTGAPRCSDPG